MAEAKTRPSAIGVATDLLTNKKSRSAIFLIISLLFVLAINSVLPVIQGQAHYTAEQIEYTYGEYKQMKLDNNNYQITWWSKQQMKLYVIRYINNHPELPEEEQLLVTVPDNFKINVYTKFFFQDTFWYVSTITSVVSSVVMFYSVFNYVLTLSRERYRRYVQLETEMEDITDKHLDPVTFEPWMDDAFNHQRKIAQHKSNVKYEIDLIERRTQYDVKRKFRRYFETPCDEILNQLGKLSRKERKYLYAKEKQLALLEESYINNYVINGRVKYFKYIYPMFVYNGTNGLGKTVDSYSQIQSDKSRLSADAAGKIANTVAITIVFAVMLTVTAVASEQQEPLWAVINIIAKIAPLFLQVPLAIDYSNRFMNNQLISNLIRRRTIALLYLADTNKQAHDTIKNQIEKESDPHA